MSNFLLFIFFIFFSSATAATTPPCTQCVLAKATLFSSDKALVGGACGYGPLALNYYAGHLAAALPFIFDKGQACGACYQIRCKNPALCTTTGTTIVVTDIHTDKTNTTDFVLSSRAFRAMALPGKDLKLIQVGIAPVEYKRVPCVFKGQNLAFKVEEFSKPPNYLAVRVLYQGGQTTITGAEVASVNKPNTWIPMSRNYGPVWDTSRAPAGQLMFRFVIKSGLKNQYFTTNNVLPANWKPGAIYNSTVQISNVALDNCAPCKGWK